MLLRFAIVALAAAAAGAAELTPSERQANIDSFEYVWKTVRDRHWEARPGGLDWQAVHDELRPKVEKAPSTAEAREVIAGMLDRLHQTHFGVFPSEVYKEFDSPGAADGETGIDVRVLEGHAIVTGVDPDSPVSRGRLCPKGSASLQLTTGGAREYRVKYRGRYEKKGVDLDLDTAMDMIAERVIAGRLAVGGRSGWRLGG